MPAITNLTINDGVSDKTYTPVSITGDTSTYADRLTTDIVGGQSEVRITFSPSSAKRTTDKTTVSVSLPRIITDVATGLAAVESVGRFTNGSYIIPPTWDYAWRLKLVNIVKSVTASAILNVTVSQRTPAF